MINEEFYTCLPFPGSSWQNWLQESAGTRKFGFQEAQEPVRGRRCTYNIKKSIGLFITSGYFTAVLNGLDSCLTVL